MDPREEIKDIAPKLSQWKQEEGYKVPFGYFDNLSNSILKKVEEDKKLKPYFEALPDQVLNKIKQEEKKVNHVTRISYYKYGFAAAMLIAFGSVVWSSIGEEIVTPAFAHLDDSGDIDYIIDELSIEEIFDSEIFDDELLGEILVEVDDYFFADDLEEDLLLDVDDEILEELL